VGVRCEASTTGAFFRVVCPGSLRPPERRGRRHHPGGHCEVWREGLGCGSVGVSRCSPAASSIRC
jgi:hypothetical protein